MVQLQYTGMLKHFKDVPDPRTRPNRIFPWQLLWGLISAALASACQTPTAIARWIREHHDDLLTLLPYSVVRLPSESTIRRTLAAVDAKQLDAAVARLVAPRPASSASQGGGSVPLDGQAIDGKNVRGVGRSGSSCLLVSLVEHSSATVLAQVGVCVYKTLAALGAPGAARHGYIEWLRVDEGFRRRGLARALLSAALADLRARDCMGCWLTTAADNWPAQTLYQSIGFEVVDCATSFRRTRQ